MIIVSGKVTAKPGSLEAIREAMTEVITQTRKEAGCQYYSYGVDVLDPNSFIVLEYWDSWETLEAHFQTGHIKVWREALSKIAIIELDVRFIEAGEERDFLR